MSADKKPVVTFLDARPRFRVVTMEWPLSFGGKEYREVYIVRLTVKEVADFIEGLSGDDGATLAHLPMFRDADGVLIPETVLDALDDDDKFALDEAARDFLPRRFRAAPEETSAPPAGEPTAPSLSA